MYLLNFGVYTSCLLLMMEVSYYDKWFQDNKKWLIAFLTIAFASHAGLGMAIAIFGPTQPYLAWQTKVDVDTINFIYTARLTSHKKDNLFF